MKYTYISIKYSIRAYYHEFCYVRISAIPIASIYKQLYIPQIDIQ